ncbi:hypothetical protein ZEAMMB73_Zm00001d017217 [Zea mays]|nr:hypothetical protein ZEAMMB73_Zm00001d017217 [Zea mays]
MATSCMVFEGCVWKLFAIKTNRMLENLTWVLLVKLITGQKALYFGRVANQKGRVLDWVKKLHQEKQLGMMVDKGLGSN